MLVVVEPTHLKNILVKMGSSSPNFRGENKKNWKHHLVFVSYGVCFKQMRNFPALELRTFVPYVLLQHCSNQQTTYLLLRSSDVSQHLIWTLPLQYTLNSLLLWALIFEAIGIYSNSHIINFITNPHLKVYFKKKHPRCCCVSSVFSCMIGATKGAPFCRKRWKLSSHLFCHCQGRVTSASGMFQSGVPKADASSIGWSNTKRYQKIAHCWWFRNPVNSPVEGSLSHTVILQGFFSMQTVVGNGSSEPSTVLWLSYQTLHLGVHAFSFTIMSFSGSWSTEVC